MRGQGLSERTIQSRKAMFHAWERWIGPRMFEATHHDIEAWIGSRRDDWSAETRKRAFSDMRMLYKWLERDDLVARNPTNLAWAPKVPGRVPRPASTAAVQACLNYGERLVERRGVALMAFGGLRSMEVAALQWGMIDFGDDLMWIDGKGGQRRFVFINQFLRPWLAALDGSDPDDPVYPGRRGGQLTPATVSYRIGQHCRAAGHHVTAHQFRHYYATRLYAKCGDIEVVKAQLGHANVSTTEIYTKIPREKIRQGALLF